MWLALFPPFLCLPRLVSLYPALSSALHNISTDNLESVIFINLGVPRIGLDAQTVRGRSMPGVSHVGDEGDGGQETTPQGYWSLSWLRNKSNYLAFLIYAVMAAQKCALTPLPCLIQCIVIPPAWVCRCQFRHEEKLCLVLLEKRSRRALWAQGGKNDNSF